MNFHSAKFSLKQLFSLSYQYVVDICEKKLQKYYWRKTAQQDKLIIGKKRKISFAQASEFAEKYKIPYMEVSVKTGYNITELKNFLVNQLLLSLDAAN